MPQFEKNVKAGIVEHVIAARQYSVDGLRAAFAEETAFRLVCGELFLVLLAAIFFANSWLEGVVLVVPAVLCVVVELLNSAIENTVDRISLEIDVRAKKAKDMGSAAQFCAQLFLLAVWLSYFLWS